MKNYESLDFLAKFPLDEARLPIVKLKLLNKVGIKEEEFDAHPMLNIPGQSNSLSLYTILYVAKSLGAKNDIQYLLSASPRDKAVAILQSTQRIDGIIAEIINEELSHVSEIDKILAGWYDEH